MFTPVLRAVISGPLPCRGGDTRRADDTAGARWYEGHVRVIESAGRVGDIESSGRVGDVFQLRVVTHHECGEHTPLRRLFAGDAITYCIAATGSIHSGRSFFGLLTSVLTSSATIW